jgi:D-alanyl-lipoteichoic acid acyltransferase DltB (MBOAT superfamily)
LLVRYLASVITSLRTRQWLLLVASYLFYISWGPRFLIVLVFSSAINFVLGRHLQRRVTPVRLWLGVGFNLLLLCFFKYLPLVGEAWSSNPLASKLGHIALPLGLSFWTFQAISYLVDIYREETLDPSLLEFCLYMAFWPTVMSGPICRLPEMLPQFRKPYPLVWQDVGNGTQRVLMGIFMMALSQILSKGFAPGQGVDGGFARPAEALGGMDVWCLALGYGFQLFFNFAGYSHLVIGAAQIFSIRLRENFDRPYLSTTPSMFWNRWHMSLSTWIRDYVFFPLAMIRREMWWRNASLVIAMFVFGLWHRGSLLFMCWGIYQGLFLVSHRQWQQLRRRWDFPISERLLTPLSWLVTFAGVTIGWVLFRAESKEQAGRMLITLLSPASYTHHVLYLTFYGLVMLVMAGYFSVTAISAGLQRLQQAATSRAAAGECAGASSGRIALLVGERWIWVAPVAAALLLYAYLLIGQAVPLMAPMMYQVF